MPYVKKTTVAGKSIIIQKEYKGPAQAGIKRAKKEKPTREAVAKVNERYAVRKLTALMNANFEQGDLHIVLTYRREARVEPHVAQQYLRVFIKNLRKLYKAAGQTLKYIYATEYENKAIHHHLLLKYFNVAEIAKLWQHGMVRPTVLYTSEYSKLAAYFVKETQKTFKNSEAPSKLRYVASKNLIRPEPQEEIIQSKRWAKTPKPIAGYEIVQDSIENGASDVTGLPCQYYIMTAIDDHPTTVRR